MFLALILEHAHCCYEGNATPACMSMIKVASVSDKMMVLRRLDLEEIFLHVCGCLYYLVCCKNIRVIGLHFRILLLIKG